MQELTKIEQNQLKKHEAIIQAGKNTWLLVGNSLAEIRDNRLYRAEHGSFQEYCEKRWGWGRHRALQFINSAAAVQPLTKEMVTIVTTESAGRELAKVPAAKREEVVRAAAKAGPVTAKTINVAAKKIIVDAEVVVKDATGVPVHKSLVELWNRGEEIDAVLHYLSKLKSAVKAAKESSDLLWREVNFDSVLADLGKAWTAIKCAKPYAVCPQCQGHPSTQPKGQCRLCLGRGIVSEFRYRTVPEELRRVREKAMSKK